MIFNESPFEWYRMREYLEKKNIFFLLVNDDVIKTYIRRHILFFLHSEAIVSYQKLMNTQRAT